MWIGWAGLVLCALRNGNTDKAWIEMSSKSHAFAPPLSAEYRMEGG